MPSGNNVYKFSDTNTNYYPGETGSNSDVYNNGCESQNGTGPTRRRLLLIDENISDRKANRRLLSSQGDHYQIDEAGSRSEALNFCDRQEFDCILLDFNLGGMDALKILPELKKRSSDGRLAVILVTGKGNEYLAAKAFKAGVQDYIVKTNLHVDVLVNAVEHAIRTIDRERSVEKQRVELEFLGLHDHLTGLPNRKLFLDRLDQALLQADRHSTKFSLISMDLNKFKQINDSLGHEAGDMVIIEVARRMRETLRATDTVARFGGDEFVGLLEVIDYEDSISVAEKLIDAVLKPIEIDNLQVDVGLSIGISNFPKNGSNSRVLLRKADAAMYQAKKGNCGVVVHTDDYIPNEKRAVSIATEISNIVESDTLEMEYQPKVCLATNKVIGAEALVRWRHPSLGLLPPVEFIPTVERTQKIRPMSFYIAEMAIRQCAIWRESGFEIPVAVNLSAKVLDNQDLPEKLLAILYKWTLPPELLTLEVTETGALANQQIAAGILRELANMGVKISIDDFGSGYTSFRYLRDFAVHELKIDRMFINELVNGDRDESIVRSMLELGRGFGVGVVAEGIENEDILEKLKSMECGIGQGYYFSRPMSPNQFILWSSEWAAKQG